MQNLLQYRWSRFFQVLRNIFKFIFTVTFSCHFFHGYIFFSTEELKLHAGGRKCLVTFKTCYQTLNFFVSLLQLGIFKELNTGTGCKSLFWKIWVQNLEKTNVCKYRNKYIRKKALIFTLIWHPKSDCTGVPSPSNENRFFLWELTYREFPVSLTGSNQKLIST